MSVIDKMLRDLDRRQSASAGNKAAADGDGSLPRGTLLVDAASSKSEGGRVIHRPAKAIIGGFVLLVLLVAAGWWLKKNDYLAGPLGPAVLRPVPALPPTPQGLGAPNKPEAEGVKSISEPSVTSKKASRKGGESGAAGGGGAVRVVPQSESVPISAPALQSLALPAEMSLKMDSVLKEIPVANASANASASVGQTLPGTLVPPSVAIPVPSAAPAAGSIARPASAMEALAHAQRLWNSGARLPAMDLLSEALALLERTPLAVAGGNGGSVAPLAAVARELARMELAEGRVTQALEMLTRLQPNLANVPDIWAMRGNAAQRLGRHEESVAAYRAALKLRPDEPRWLLGAAVSLAAQGQTSAAAEMVEKARAGGALSRDMAAYLQQLGVTVSER